MPIVLGMRANHHKASMVPPHGVRWQDLDRHTRDGIWQVVQDCHSDMGAAASFGRLGLVLVLVINIIACHPIGQVTSYTIT